MSKPPNRILRLGALIALTGVAACTDRNPAGPTGKEFKPPVAGTPGPSVAVALVECRAELATLTVSCGEAPQASEEVRRLLVGGQGVYVRLTGSNTAYNPGTGLFTFDVTVENLIPQSLGTTDGTTLDPGGVRVFFATGPAATGGTGVPGVVPDGFGDFLGAGQAFYQWDEILGQGEVSSPKQWRLIVPPTVTGVEFQVAVSAPVPFPGGYVALDGLLPGSAAGALPPGSTRPLVATVHTVVGTVVPGAVVSFGTSDPLCATVSAAGVVTGVRAASCQVTATAGPRSGSLLFDVTGTVRVWEGDESADWSAGGNWAGGLVPAEADSVRVPAGTPSAPALTSAVSVRGVEVADGATLWLGAFTLSAAADVATGPTPGSGILATGGELVLAGTGTLAGRVPSLRVLGTYTLAADVVAVAPETIDMAELASDGWEMHVESQ